MNLLLPAAETIAHQMGEPEPGAEHLVLAALDLPDGSARRAFVRAGADPDRFRDALSAQHADALRSIGIDAPDDQLDGHIPAPARPSGPLRSRGSLHKVFRRVVKLVRKERSQLYGAYVVLVASETDTGTVARALSHMQVEPNRLAAAARDELNILNS